MATTYVRRFNLKSSLSNKQVNDFWKTLMREFIPAIQKVKGVRSCKVYSGAGALRADMGVSSEWGYDDTGGTVGRVDSRPGERGCDGCCG